MSIQSRPGKTTEQSPFHEGEIRIQKRLGISERMEQNGRAVIRTHMPDQHRTFFKQLPFVIVGSVDRHGQPWASILTGRPGFLQAPDATHLRVAAKPLYGDPLHDTLADGARLGLLGIELHTRRRNRVNGIVEGLVDDGFTLAVQQSFGNCPQYIQLRETLDNRADEATDQRNIIKPIHRNSQLDARAEALIADADTFFIASAFKGAGDARSDSHGADVSHRGGKPGFVRIDDNRTLTIPDFVGNFFFNTLGNLLLDPRAGLMFIDFTNGDVLYLTGRAEIIFDGVEVKTFAAAERLLRFHITQAILVEGSLTLRWSAPQASPILSRTGSWEDAARSVEANKSRNTYRRFVITNAEDESATIRSLLLEPVDGGGIIPHEPGQFLPIRINVPGADKPVLRTYTLSDAPNGKFYRLSIKREQHGVGSSWLHAAQVGSEIEALAPRGDFTLKADSQQPIVMISAGVGITPMIAMLNAILVNEGRSRHPNSVIFIHGARDSHEHAFASHLRLLQARHANLIVHIAYSNPRAGDIVGITHDSVGRVDIKLIVQLIPEDVCDVYLCGPGGFMTALHDGLLEIGVAENRIRSESFGPASIAAPRKRKAVSTPLDSVVGDEAIEVVFAKSNVIAFWTPSSGTLLDLAEAHGLTPAFSCRAGICGTCASGISVGEVAYSDEPLVAVKDDEVLICCSTPRPGPHIEGAIHRHGVTLDL